METALKTSKNERNKPFQVVLEDKAKETLSSRCMSRYISQKADWVEDGLHLVIEQFCTGGPVSDYLMLTYPANMPEEKRRNDTGSERKTLRYRFRYMIKCLGLISGNYRSLVQWHFSGLEFMMEIFEEVLRQALGKEIADRFGVLASNVRGIWKVVNPQIKNEADFTKVLRELSDEADEVFEAILVACIAKEREADAAERHDETISSAVATIETAAAQCHEAAKIQKRATKIVCKVAGLAAGMNEAAGDSTSRYAGLDDYPEARRTALKGAIDMSHAEYPISRNSKRGTHTIKKLAARYWKANEDRLEQLAKLPNGAGFKNAESLASTLYRLSKRFPNADYFAWA